MVKKRKTKKPKNRKKLLIEPLQKRDLVDSDSSSEIAVDRWETLRQGARNVAGVSWQIAVTAHLLIASRAGELPFTRFVPEGYEDIDCVSSDGQLSLVQVKEKGAGTGRMAAGAVAEVLVHALTANKMANGGLLALVTDGKLGSELEFTGWNSTVAETSKKSAIENLSKNLRKKNLSDEQVADVLHRARFIRLPWNLRGSTESLLYDHLELHPAIASLVVGEIYAHLSSIAAAQRSTTSQSSRAIDLNDIDAFVTRLQSTVDMTGLDAATKAGICAPADFTVDPDLRPDQFYLGVDGAPMHIAAELDVLRPLEMTQIIEAAKNERYALICGPSGSGKSVLLWRAARDAVLGSRLVRVQRVSSDNDVELLVRHIKLARASTNSPIIVVADNLGRPHMERWPNLVDRLYEMPSVIIFGACRAEDFHPRIARGIAKIIQPILDEDTANDIAIQLDLSGLSQVMSSSEAFKRSEGLMMEYLALLLRGKRLVDIIAEQAANLREPGRELQRSVARLISVAHSLGFSIRADILAKLVAPHVPPESVGDALDVLRGEHVITVDGASWRGLHELRSRILADQLHLSPPPSFGDTLCSVSHCLTLQQAGWLLRRVAERYPQWTPDVARTLAEQIANPDLNDVQAIAEVIEGAERADNLLYARECLPIFQKYCPPEFSVSQLAPLAYGIRHQGLRRSLGSELGTVLLQKLRPITSAMPDRPDVILTAITSKLTNLQVLRLLSNCEVVDKVRLLEALSVKIRFNENEIKQILSNSPVPNDRLAAAIWSRLITLLFDYLNSSSAKESLGDVKSRAETIARSEPWAISIETKSNSPSITVLEAFSEGVINEALPWEVTRETTSNITETIAISLANRLASACPDAKTVKVRTLNPAGLPLKADGYEYAHREISPESIPNKVGVRRNVGFCASIRRISAAETWTSILKTQVEIGKSLQMLAESAIRRLNPHDNSRRRKDWIAQVEEARLKTNLVRSEPQPLDRELPTSHAKADEAEREPDQITRALGETASALSSVVNNQNFAAVALLVDQAVEQLKNTGKVGVDILAGLGKPIPESLIDHMTRLVDFAAAANSEPGRLRNLNFGDSQAIDAFIDEVLAERQKTQGQLIETTFGSIQGRKLYVFRDPSLDRIASNDTAVLVTVPLALWQETIEIVSALDETFKHRLESRVIVAPQSEGKLKMYGVQLRRFGTTNFIPAQATLTHVFAEINRIEVSVQGENGRIQQLINTLIRISWLNKLRELRPVNWENDLKYSPPSMSQVSEQLNELRANSGAEGAVDVLLEQLKLELDGNSEMTLAELVSDNQSGIQEMSAVGIEILSSLGSLLELEIK